MGICWRGWRDQCQRRGCRAHTCLIADQFRRLKFGDRFFYTHTDANGLSKVVKDEILQRTLGDVLCDVTRLGKVQTWVTLQPNSDYNPYKTCSSNRQLNMRAIADEIAQELSPEDSRFPE